MNLKIHNFLYSLLIFLSVSVCAENNPLGSPFIKNYTPKEYKASSQNWAIIQDDRGVMYFGNSNGVLEYDGVSWRLIKTVENAVVRSLAKDNNGKIYVGSFGDFGYLTPDSTGRLIYQSLQEKIPIEYRDFSDIWNIHVIKDRIYFKSYKYLFELHDGLIKVILPEVSEFNETHVYNDTLYVEYWQVGLGKLVGDSIELILTKDDFNNKYPGVGIFLPYDKDNILLGNPNSGLFLFNGKKVTKLKNEIDEFLIKYQSYFGLKLDINRFAFSTISGGIVIMKADGTMEHIINKSNGLTNNTVWQMYASNKNSLWIATDNGINYVEYPSPITKFDKYSELIGTINQILRYKDKIYIAGHNGLFYFEENDNGKNNSIICTKVESLNDIIWSLLPFQGDLLVGTNNGLYKFNGTKVDPIRKENSVYLYKSIYYKNRIYVGLIDGLASMHYENGKWIDDGKIVGISEYVNNKIVETENGDLWVGHYQGIIQVNFSGKFSLNPIVKKFNENDGLPANNNNYVFSVFDKIVFATKKELYKYDRNQNIFIPDSTFGSEFANGSRSIFTIANDEFGKTWMYSNNEIGFIPKYENTWINRPFLRLTNYEILLIYPDINGIIWFAGSDGFFKYNPKILKSYNSSFPALIRTVSTQNDSIIYGGSFFDIKENTPEYDYNLNALRFDFALPSYDNEESNQFQFYLEGFDKDWSYWSNEPKANYTNIPEGRYIFRVRAKNIYNVISNEASYAFKILPPWFRTFWAYIIYSLFIISIVFGMLKLRSFKLEYEKKQLEKTIEERTDEIQVKNKQLEEQAEKLKELDEIKSRFFANISHELRTPLTLIKGPTEELVNKSYPGDKDKALNSILTNTNRMLRLINELLDLSKLESGSMKLNAKYQKLSPFINYVVKSFSSLADSRNINLLFLIPEEEIEIYFDREKLEKVLYNLLSNAFKFTPEDGYITIAAHRIVTKTFPDGAVEISVHDSGMGIPENEIDQIFNRFIQAHNSGNTRLEGSGIGLALSKELIELHGGEITVKSLVDEGTEFDVILPIGKEHLSEDDIIEKGIPKEDQQKAVQFDIEELNSEIPMKTINEVTSDFGDKCLVLIIEDHSEVREYIKEHLQKNYDIIEAENGKKGLNLANEQLPDLIVSDVMMPEIDGFELTEQLKKNELTNHIPIILLTAKASDEAKIEGLETGADAYMAKPFNAKELEVRVKKLIENRNSLREKFKKEFLLEPEDVTTTSLDDEFIKRVHDKIEEKMADPDFNVETLLKEFALGQRQFTRKVIALTGQSPVQFIRIMRLKKAMNLIKQKAGSVSQIAFDVGFSNLSYFSKSFQQQFGKLPSEIA